MNEVLPLPVAPDTRMFWYSSTAVLRNSGQRLAWPVPHSRSCSAAAAAPPPGALLVGHVHAEHMDRSDEIPLLDELLQREGGHAVLAQVDVDVVTWPVPGHFQARAARKAVDKVTLTH